MTYRDELVHVKLTEHERRVLDRGLSEWHGPAACTEALACAMGFGSVRELFEESDRILAALEARRPLSRWDWTRALLATEIVFASDVVGSGVDWELTTGLYDDHTIGILRALQRELMRAQAVVRLDDEHPTGAQD